MSNSLWTTIKRIGINLSISPSNPLFHPCVHDHPIKKMYSVLPENLMSFWFYLAFEQREQEKRRELIYLSRTVLLLTLNSHSRSFRVALVLCLFVMELMVFFCLFWLFFFFNVIFRFHFVQYHSNMHACTFFFFLEERLVIHPPIHSFVVYSLYHLSAFLSNLQTEHV